MSIPKQVRVTGLDGLIGYVDTSTMDSGWAPGTQSGQEHAHQVVVIYLDDGKRVWVDEDILEKQEGGGFFIPLTRSQLFERGEVREEDADLVIPVIHEQARVSRQEIPHGVVRITKHVHERVEEIDEPLFRENVHVERIRLNRVLEAPAELRYEGDTMVIPVMEEVLVIEKRIVLKEEIRVTRRREEVHEPRRVTLREEQVRVNRTDVQKKNE